jgi:hypothetical protein
MGKAATRLLRRLTGLLLIQALRDIGRFGPDLCLTEICGERAGARTQDPVIKSHVLYRLSYALAPKAATA